MKKIRLIISMLIIITVFVGNLETAKAAEYVVNEVNVICNGTFYSEGSNLVKLENDEDITFWEREKFTRITVKTISSEDGSESKNEFICKGNTYACMVNQNNVFVLEKQKKKNNVVLQVRNKKGKLKDSYKITVTNKKVKKITGLWIEDITIKGNKIYYIADISYKNNKRECYFQCYNINKKKVVSSKKVKSNAYYILDNNKRYRYDSYKNKIIQYNLKGKKSASYKLPEGEKKITAHLTHLNNVTYEYGFVGLDVVDNYIYYCNRNGVYRCDTKGDGLFEMIYDGSNDALFNPAYGEERFMECFKVLENGTFFIRVDDYEHLETCSYFYKQK